MFWMNSFWSYVEEIAKKPPFRGFQWNNTIKSYLQAKSSDDPNLKLGGNIAETLDNNFPKEKKLTLVEKFEI